LNHIDGLKKERKKQKMSKRTRVALVLDKSGSMGCVRNEAITGFNEALDEIIATGDDGGDTTVSLFTFNHDVDTEFLHRRTEQIKRLTSSSYNPGGSTALRDAVGKAIESIQAVDELEGDAAALVIVVTDGYENASKVWSQNDLAEKIQELEDTEKWTFTFMCANIDPTKIEREFNVAAGNVGVFLASPAGVNDMAGTVTSSLTSYMSSRSQGVTSSRSFYDENNSNSQGD